MPGSRAGRVAATVGLAVGLAAALVMAGAAPAAATNDTHWDRQWGPVRIGAPAAWATTTGAGVTIGVVDTGIDLNHEDLAGKIAGSTACLGTGGDPARCGGSAQDQDGHGTHVAGIAAAAKDNGRGIAGVAPDARLLVAKVFGRNSGSLDDVRAGIQWVVDRGAKVVNLSLETDSGLLGLFGGGGSADLAAAVEYAWARGAIPVLAAGNASLFSSSANYGAANAVVVGATGRNDEPAAYSVPTGNAKWALVAPGGNVARGGSESAIYSTFPSNRYTYIEGTSMAVPHVSGALALLLARGLSPQRAVEVLLATAERGVGCGGGSPTCAGRLDVARAVAATGPPAAPPPAPAAPPTAAPAPPTAPPATAGPATAAPPVTGTPTTVRAPSTTQPPVPTAAPTTGAAVPSTGAGSTPGAAASPDQATTPGAPADDVDPAAPTPSAPGAGGSGEEIDGALFSAAAPADGAAGGTPAGFRVAAALAIALLALVVAGLVVRAPAR